MIYRFFKLFLLGDSKSFQKVSQKPYVFEILVIRAVFETNRKNAKIGNYVLTGKHFNRLRVSKR